MLHLVFRLGVERYALSSRQIVEVLPILAWRTMPGVPDTVPGVFSYHGTLVPVLDLGQLVHGQPTERQKARLVLVNYDAGSDQRRLLGLLVESATRLQHLDDNDFAASPVKSDVRYAGPVATDADGLVQRIELEQLVPDDLWERLHDATEPGSG